MKLDETDINLLELLQADSKKTTKEYALKLGLSTTAIYERIKRLERTGAIRNYVALVDKAVVDRNFTVNKLTAMNHIGSTQSSFTIKEVKHSTAIPL